MASPLRTRFFNWEILQACVRVSVLGRYSILITIDFRGIFELYDVHIFTHIINPAPDLTKIPGSVTFDTGPEVSANFLNYNK